MNYCLYRIVPPAKRPAIDGSSTLGGYDNYQEQPAYPAGRGGKNHRRNFSLSERKEANFFIACF